MPGGLKPLPKGESSGRPSAVGQRPLPQIGREFGVPLPAQRPLSPVHRVMAGLPVGRGDAEPPRQGRKGSLIDGGAALGHEGELDEGARLLHQRIRARMHLADRVGTARMRRKAEHGAGQRGGKFKFRRLDGHLLRCHEARHGYGGRTVRAACATLSRRAGVANGAATRKLDKLIDQLRPKALIFGPSRQARRTSLGRNLFQDRAFAHRRRGRAADRGADPRGHLARRRPAARRARAGASVRRIAADPARRAEGPRGARPARHPGTAAAPMSPTSSARSSQSPSPSFSPPTARLPSDYLEYRREIEGVAAEFAARRATPDDLALLDRIVGRMQEVHPSGDMEAEAAIDVEFHQAIGECAHNIMLMHTLRSCYRLLSEGVLQNRILVFNLPRRQRHLARPASGDLQGGPLRRSGGGAARRDGSHHLSRTGHGGSRAHRRLAARGAAAPEAAQLERIR